MNLKWHSLASRPRQSSLYLLALLPTVTDLFETGALPKNPRGWLTEIAAGLVIAWLVTWLRHELQRLEQQSMLDPLTGIGNRRAFAARARELCSVASRTDLPLSLIYVDMDGFKRINDDLGHATGDEALRHVASAIRNSSREHADLGFRLGGDEFALLLPHTDASQSAQVLHRIEQSCRAAGSPWATGYLSVSGGIATYHPDQSVDDFVQRADEAMRAQKIRHRPHPATRRVVAMGERSGGRHD